MHVYNNNEMPHTWILNLRIFIIPIVLYLLYVLKEYRVSQTLRQTTDGHRPVRRWPKPGIQTVMVRRGKLRGLKRQALQRKEAQKKLGIGVQHASYPCKLLTLEANGHNF